MLHPPGATFGGGGTACQPAGASRHRASAIWTSSAPLPAHRHALPYISSDSSALPADAAAEEATCSAIRAARRMPRSARRAALRRQAPGFPRCAHRGTGRQTHTRSCRASRRRRCARLACPPPQKRRCCATALVLGLDARSARSLSPGYRRRRQEEQHDARSQRRKSSFSALAQQSSSELNAACINWAPCINCPSHQLRGASANFSPNFRPISRSDRSLRASEETVARVAHTASQSARPPHPPALTMAARHAAPRHSSRDRQGSRVPSKIVDKNTGKTYRTGKMLGKVRGRRRAWPANAAAGAGCRPARPACHTAACR
jgi:hypothetical protein